MSNKFNEDEYVMHFFTNINTSSRHKLIPCKRPTLRAEGDLGYDMRIEMGKPGIPIFFQFKSPYRIKDTEKAEIEFHTNADASELDFCISFRKNKKFRQHKMLRKTMKNASPSFAYYTSPRFDTQDDLMTEFQRDAVHLKSAFFCVDEIGPIKENGKMENICYSVIKNYALICPIFRTIELRDYNNIAELAGVKIDAHRIPFSVAIDNMLNYLQKHFNIRISKRRMLVESVEYSSPEELKYSQWKMASSAGQLQGVINKNRYNENDGFGYEAKLKYLADLLYSELNVVLCVYQRISFH